MMTSSGITYSSWMKRNAEALSDLARNLELTPGWGLWPVSVPQGSAPHHISFFAAWWSERIGGRLAMLPLTYPHSLAAAPLALAQLSGDPVVSPWATLAHSKRMIDPAQKLGPLDAAIVFHDGTGWTGNRKPDGWHNAMLSINLQRDSFIRGLGAPLIWMGPQNMLDSTMESAPDFWSVREIRTTLL